MADALSKKVQEMHVASLSIFQSDLRHQIVNHTVGDEMYELVKDKLQQQSLEKRYEGYKLEEDGLLTYKNRIYNLYYKCSRFEDNFLWMRSIKIHILVTQDVKRQLL